MSDATGMYLELLKSSLLNIPYVENDVRIRHLLSLIEYSDKNGVPVRVRDEFLFPVEEAPNAWKLMQDMIEIAGDGRQNRPFAHCMMGRKRLDNLQFCLDAIVADRVPGDLLEAGVWKGAGPIFMRGYLKAHAVEGRAVWVADSFAGVPESTLPQDQGIYLSSSDLAYIAVSEKRVRELMRRYDVLDDTIRFLPGWFKDTLSKAPIDRLALLRMDGDLYESTMDTLEALYEKVSPGGFVIADDYGAIEVCKLAVDDFRRKRSIREEIVPIDWTGVYWRKTL